MKYARDKLITFIAAMAMFADASIPATETNLFTASCIAC